jgi:hypothetical protein
VSATGETKTTGKVVYNPDTHPMTNKAVPDVSTWSENGEGLMWWCHQADGSLVSGFLGGKHFVTTGAVTVEYQFSGANQPTELAWSTDHHQTAWLTGKRLAQFTHQAQESDSVLMRVRDADGGTVVARFELDGLREALQLLPCATKELATTY